MSLPKRILVAALFVALMVAVLNATGKMPVVRDAIRDGLSNVKGQPAAPTVVVDTCTRPATSPTTTTVCP